ncbi:hypothetical protein FRB94_014524 [Tulasnella sp. JGI-2019a]|nr:hypothetical protein FRB94_014524 [Tulasnella sp. JGI-2019a]
MLKCLSNVTFLDGQEDLDAINNALLTTAATLSLIDNAEYAAALHRDPVKLCQGLIAFCHASGQCWEDLQNVIIDGNKTGLFPNLKVLQLLCDLETCWASTHNMCERFLYLHEAIAQLL